MVVADSVSVFAEGTFEEQVQELVEYIARTKPESDRAAFKTPFADAFKISEGQEPVEKDEERRRKVISQVVNALNDLGEGSDKEIEGFFNLLFSHMIGIYAPGSAELSKGISQILDAVSHKRATEQTSVKYRVLSNLFNALPRTSPARLLVCKTLLKLAAENDELDNLHLTPTDVDRWLTEWDASPEEKTDFLRSVVDAFNSAGEQEAGFAFSVSHVRSLLPSAAEKASLELIATALRMPTFFDFDSVLRLESVQALSSNELHGLLVILNKQGLGEFRTWRAKNQSILDEYELDAAQLERKMRLLILSEMGFSKIGQNLTYTEIASALQIEVQEVEKWAIDVVRAGLLSGKLSQTTQTLHVIRAVPRGFTKEQWNVLEQRLLAWKEGLVGIQSVLSATRQSISTAVVPEQAA